MNKLFFASILYLLTICTGVAYGQCASDYVDQYARKSCANPDTLTSYFINCNVSVLSDNKFVIHNFTSIPYSIIGTEDTIVANLNCMTDSIILTPVSYSVFPGTLTYSGYGVAYQDSIVLFLHQLNPDFAQDFCYTYKRGLVLSTPENDLKQDLISVYPNPSSDKILIDGDISKLKSIYVLSVDGKLVKEYNETRNEINVSQLPPGVYVLRFHFDDYSVLSKKIIKE